MNFEGPPGRSIEALTCTLCHGNRKVKGKDGKEITCPRCNGSGKDPNVG